METEDFSIICLACLSTDNLKTDVEQYLFDVYEKITDLKICSNYENICTNCYDKLMDISNFINICKDSDKYIKNKIEFNVNTDKESSLNINNTVENHQNFNLECSSEFIQHNQLTENVTEQQVELENVGHSCTICGKFFSKLAALNRHMKVHLGEKSFECDTCGKKFNQKCTLDRHSLTHTGDRPFACNLCGKLFTRKHLIKYHISKLHPNASPDDYDMIIDEHTTNSLPVSVEDTIKKEVAEPELIEIKSDPSEIQPDETVSLNTNLLLSTDNHKIKEEINDIQQLENQESQDINQPEIDYFSDDNNTGFEFEENPDPEEENNLSPPKKKRIEIRLCSLCGKIFKRNEYLKNHMAIHLNIKPYSCKICGTGFTQRQALTRHNLVHTKERPFKCKYCDKTFTRKEKLTDHERCHVEGDPHLCFHCGKRFKDREYLRKHLHYFLMGGKARWRQKPKRCLCSECGKEFNSEHYLKAHLKTHSGEKPYMCKICDKRFSVNAGLQYHLKIHSNLKPFVCEHPQCGKTFRESSALKTHERIHTGDRPFTCKICDKGFIRRSHLTRHLKLHPDSSLLLEKAGGT